MGVSAAGLSGIGLGVWAKRPPAARAEAGSAAGRAGAIQLESSDPRLVSAFGRARERALAGVFTGDPVGDWYASNRDNRAFCMRDTAHESAVGAALLGLYPHSLNMLRRFAASIARSRNWCGYWIITKDGYPSPGEFSSDDNFGYALPANFDLVRACHRQLLWTGDRQYLDPVFTSFYDRTVSQYVEAWDPERDGIMKRREDRPRISASYHPQGHFRTGADLVAAQYGGYLAYAAIQEFKGGPGSLSQKIAGEFRSKAEVLRNRFNADWWNPAQNRFHAGVMPDTSWCEDYKADCNIYPLRFGIPEDGPKTEASLNLLEQNRPPFDSTFSYYPEVLYHYGRNDAAWQSLLELTDPAFSGYHMTETAFAAIGSIGAGLMGIQPDAPHSTVETLPRLPKGLAWVRTADVPVAANQVAVEHRGNAETRFTNQSGGPLTWRAAFSVPPSGNGAGIFIDGTAAPKLTFEHRANRQPVICASAPVKAGQTRIAKLVV